MGVCVLLFFVLSSSSSLLSAALGGWIVAGAVAERVHEDLHLGVGLLDVLEREIVVTRTEVATIGNRVDALPAELLGYARRVTARDGCEHASVHVYERR